MLTFPITSQSGTDNRPIEVLCREFCPHEESLEDLTAPDDPRSRKNPCGLTVTEDSRDQERKDLGVARAIRLHNRIGSLSPGKQADVARACHLLETESERVHARIAKPEDMVAVPEPDSNVAIALFCTTDWRSEP